ncbi:MAG: inositol 2-dehydrogenase [Myxococcaceae bacterium]|nr:inositol 2-dehydrogenase [Myxococcaceae bacterium]
MSSSPIDVALIGAGRIGVIHAGNVARHPAARLRVVVDPNRAAAERLAQRHGAQVGDDPFAAINDPSVRAMVICSPTNLHVEHITAAARAGKAIFCEKPIDLDLRRVDTCIDEVRKAGVPVFIGFNRRFDPSFRALHDQLRAGAIGRLEKVTIISRDPRPPPPSYAAVSGGIFRDMTIHDFDMARWLLGEEPTEVFASGSSLVDPEIGRAGDYDTAMVVLRTPSGKLAHIQNSRRAVYGYDQRIEVFGEKGMLQAGNRVATTVSRWDERGVVADKPLDFFLERYAEAYRLEIDHFFDAICSGRPPAPGARDGRQALVIADAALESAKSGRLVRIHADV